jgi:hypothetical protein
VSGTILAPDVEPGMLLERLDHTTVGRPAYIRCTVAAAYPVRGLVDEHDRPWWNITWVGGAAGVYAPTQRFIVPAPPK